MRVWVSFMIIIKQTHALHLHIAENVNIYMCISFLFQLYNTWYKLLYTAEYGKRTNTVILMYSDSLNEEIG